MTGQEHRRDSWIDDSRTLWCSGLAKVVWIECSSATTDQNRYRRVLYGQNLVLCQETGERRSPYITPEVRSQLHTSRLILTSCQLEPFSGWNAVAALSTVLGRVNELLGLSYSRQKMDQTSSGMLSVKSAAQHPLSSRSTIRSAA